MTQSACPSHLTKIYDLGHFDTIQRMKGQSKKEEICLVPKASHISCKSFTFFFSNDESFNAYQRDKGL